MMKKKYNSTLGSSKKTSISKVILTVFTSLLLIFGQVVLAQKIGDNLGSHEALKDLQMKTHRLLNASGIAIGTATITGNNQSIGLQLGDGKAIQVTNVLETSDITNPVAGMIVYRTSDGLLYIYHSNIWSPISNNNSTLPDKQIFIGNAANSAQAHPISGDITLSNAGVVLIQNNAITTDKIANAAVTAAKLATTTGNSKVLATTTSGTNEWTSLVKKIVLSANTTLTAVQLTPGRIIMLQNTNATTTGAAITITLPATYEFANILGGNTQTAVTIAGGGNITLYIAEAATPAPANKYIVDIVGINNPGLASSSSPLSSAPGGSGVYYFATYAGGGIYNPPNNQPAYLAGSNGFQGIRMKVVATINPSNFGTVFVLQGGKTYELEGVAPCAASPVSTSPYCKYTWGFYRGQDGARTEDNPTVALTFFDVGGLRKTIFTVPGLGDMHVSLRINHTTPTPPQIETSALYFLIKELK